MRKRWIAIAVCLSFAVVRMLRPDLKIDVITVWLLVIASVFFLMPELRSMIPLVKRIRVGDTEIELKDQIRDAGEKTEQAVEALASKSEPAKGVGEPGSDVHRQARQEDASRDIEDVTHVAISSPRAALLLLSAKLEEQINRRLQESGVYRGARNISLVHAVDAGVKAGVFPPEILGAFRDFWAVRNRVAHGTALDVEDNTVTSLVGIGIELLRVVAS